LIHRNTDKRAEAELVIHEPQVARQQQSYSYDPHSALPILCASRITASSVIGAYRCVVVMLACPNTCCSDANDPPRSSHWHANVCRIW